MNRRAMVLRLAAVLLCAVLLFASCSGSQPLQAGKADKLQELGDKIVDDLQRIILPNRRTPENLVEYGYVLSKGNESKGLNALAEFFVSYEGGNGGEVTMIFAEDSFVVSRVIFVDGAGYYLRYEYDPGKPEEIAVNGRLIDGCSLKYQSTPPKWRMTLTLQNKQIAQFSFRNPD